MSINIVTNPLHLTTTSIGTASNYAYVGTSTMTGNPPWNPSWPGVPNTSDRTTPVYPATSTQPVQETKEQDEQKQHDWTKFAVTKMKEYFTPNKSLNFEVDHIDFGRKTTVFWKDGTQTTVRCAKDDPFSEYYAFAAAVTKKVYGNHSTACRIIKEKDSREIERIKREKNLEEQKERERVAAKRRKARIKHMARKIAEERAAQKLAERIEV